MFKLIGLLIISSVIIKAQFIKGNLGSFFNQFPQSVVKISGIGNRGFDDELGFYNMKYSFTDSILSISLIGLVEAGTLRNDHYDNNISRFESENKIFPEFSVKLKKNNFQFQLLYINNLVFSLIPASGTWILKFRTSTGAHEISTERPLFLAYERTLQLSAAAKISNNTSFTAGLINNQFEINNNWRALQIKFFTKWADYFQFFASVNHSFSKDALSYLMLKSQNSLIIMNKSTMFNGEDLIINDAYLSIPGNIGYGFQYRFWDRLKLSIEFSHEFLEANEEKKLQSGPLKMEYHIWNNEFTAGANCTLIPNLLVGAAVSKYWKYDNNIYYHFDFFGESPNVGPSAPITILGSVQYTLFNYSLSVFYQYTRLEYNSVEFGRKLIDYGNFIKAALTVNL